MALAAAALQGSDKVSRGTRFVLTPCAPNALLLGHMQQGYLMHSGALGYEVVVLKAQCAPRSKDANVQAETWAGIWAR